MKILLFSERGWHNNNNKLCTQRCVEVYIIIILLYRIRTGHRVSSTRRYGDNNNYATTEIGKKKHELLQYYRRRQWMKIWRILLLFFVNLLSPPRRSKKHDQGTLSVSYCKPIIIYYTCFLNRRSLVVRLRTVAERHIVESGQN